MNKSKAVDPTQGVTNSVDPHTIYAAGGLFTEHELATNLVNAGLLAEELEGLDDSGTFQAMMKAELNVVQKSVDEIAGKVIDGLEAVIKMKSPYPPEYREIVYKALRYSPGSGFDQLLTASELDELIHRLRIHGTL
jgi:hypothetical protein